MPMMIDPKLVTLAQLLEGRLFRIPEYQRAYSWSSRQRADLFDDIGAVIKAQTQKGDEAKHFMATVVVLERGKRTIIADEYAVVDVVDGQQRLTTLILLLRALEKGLANRDVHRKLRTQLDELLVKDDALSLLLLQTNHDTSNVFVDYIREGNRASADTKPSTRAEKALRDAIQECEGYVAQFDADGLLSLASILRNRLTFILHTLADEGTVYTVFEVLNSRGLPVAWIDRLKSMLMAIAFEAGDPGGEHLAELHETWKEVYRALGVRQGMSDEALRFAAVLLTGELTKGRLLSAEDAADAVRRWCSGSTKKAIEGSRWLVRMVDALNRLHNQSRLSPLVNISQARFVAAAIDLSSLSDAEKASCLEQWERTVFRVFGIAEKDARTLSGQMVRLGIDIQKGKKSGQVACDELKRMAQNKSYGTIRDELEDVDLYNGWRWNLRFLLYRYEQHLAREAGEQVQEDTWAKIWAARADDTVEHIIPQAAADAEGFTGDRIFVHRLGNLVVLPPKVNVQLGAAAFEDKRRRYADSSLFHVRRVGAATVWDGAAIEARENDIIAWAEKEFGP
jgi:hypothetical protein